MKLVNGVSCTFIVVFIFVINDIKNDVPPSLLGQADLVKTYLLLYCFAVCDREVVGDPGVGKSTTLL